MFFSNNKVNLVQIIKANLKLFVIQCNTKLKRLIEDTLGPVFFEKFKGLYRLFKFNNILKNLQKNLKLIDSTKGKYGSGVRHSAS